MAYIDGYQKLANAIILQAVKDFKPAYRRLLRRPNDKRAQDKVREITEFFSSQYFEFLTDLDGPTLLHQIIKELDEKYGQNGLT